MLIAIFKFCWDFFAEVLPWSCGGDFLSGRYGKLSKSDTLSLTDSPSSYYRNGTNEKKLDYALLLLFAA
jgi:hypothetical protein